MYDILSFLQGIEHFLCLLSTLLAIAHGQSPSITVSGKKTNQGSELELAWNRGGTKASASTDFEGKWNLGFEMQRDNWNFRAFGSKSKGSGKEVGVSFSMRFKRSVNTEVSIYQNIPKIH
jgi:hypothetical protein